MRQERLHASLRPMSIRRYLLTRPTAPQAGQRVSARAEKRLMAASCRLPHVPQRTSCRSGVTAISYVASPLYVAISLHAARHPGHPSFSASAFSERWVSLCHNSVSLLVVTLPIARSRMKKQGKTSPR